MNYLVKNRRIGSNGSGFIDWNGQIDIQKFPNLSLPDHHGENLLRGCGKEYGNGKLK